LDYKKIPHTADQIIVLLGDVGVNYNRTLNECVQKQKLQDSGRTYFCIHGNHEMRPENIESYHERTNELGTFYVEDAYPNILFAKDGEIYNLENRKVLVLGGAYSVDKWYRLASGYKWFADEQISPEKRKEILKRIKKIKKVDLVLSHTCPEQWQPTDLFLRGLDQSTVDKSMEEWLSKVEQALEYDHWLFAHFHANRMINEKATMLYGKIISINDLMEET
jgi:hypothetical protein